MKKSLKLAFNSVLTLILMFLPLAAINASDLQILNVTTSIEGATVTLKWETNIISSGRVDYGEKDTYGLFLASGDNSHTTHSVKLQNLKPKTTYHFQITSWTDRASLSTFDRTFKTGDSKSTEALEITGINLAYITGTSVTVQWTTDKEADALVRYGKTTNYGASRGDGARKLYHDVTIGNLAVATGYHLQVESKDKDGNKATYTDIGFRTLETKQAENETLTITDIRPLTKNDANLSADGALVSWKTNHLATTIVHYGTGTRLGSSVRPKIFRTFFHEVKLTGLKPGTRYYFKIESTDVFGHRIVTDTMSFSTRDLPTPVQPEPTPEVLGYQSEAFTPTQTLYKDSSSGKVYAVRRGSKLHVSNPRSFEAYGYSWRNVRTVSPSYLNSIPTTKLVKTSDAAAVYYLYQRGDRQLRLQIPTPEIFNSYQKNSWLDIAIISDFDLDAIPEARLIKSAGPEVYQLENGRKHLIPSAEVFNRSGLRWSDIVEVNQKQLNHYPAGIPLD